MKKMKALKKYLETINKNDCPQDCELQSKKEIEIALVPPPKEVLGIIISRDPTTKWLDKGYEDAKDLSNTKYRKKLFDTAIPKMLVGKIKDFADITELKDTIYEKVYWTHLHKCFTDSSDESTKFKNKNAQECADKWLTEELNCAISDKTKFIIALGKDVQKWVCEWREDYYEKSKHVKVIYFPHPSPANVGNYFSWRPQRAKDEEKLKKRINELLNLCK